MTLERTVAAHRRVAVRFMVGNVGITAGAVCTLPSTLPVPQCHSLFLAHLHVVMLSSVYGA